MVPDGGPLNSMVGLAVPGGSVRISASVLETNSVESVLTDPAVSGAAVGSTDT